MKPGKAVTVAQEPSRAVLLRYLYASLFILGGFGALGLLLAGLR
ncbi:MAG: hypothetical protein QY320_05665 [Gammaproteobacteria bacterium]|nr:MAG: hypothetical protein QY320_05665 [Gammaproteobacteria bacterium]